MKKILFLITLVIISGCSVLDKKEDEVATKKEPEVPFYERESKEQSDLNKDSAIWGEETGSLYSDQKSRKVGDIVAIIIRENATANQTASNSTDKSANISAEAGTGLLNFLPELGAGAESESDNSGSSSRSGNLSAQVSARIYKKDNNGNLYLKGSRNVLINKELQKIEISGYVRPEDITLENTVESSYLADAKVTYDGKMVLDGKAEPGIISNFFGSIVGFLF
ncbi:MAG: flagellar basal body L-ring protein FlgH [Fusobacteriota bacterium]